MSLIIFNDNTEQFVTEAKAQEILDVLNGSKEPNKQQEEFCLRVKEVKLELSEQYHNLRDIQESNLTGYQKFQAVGKYLKKNS